MRKKVIPPAPAAVQDPAAIKLRTAFNVPAWNTSMEAVDEKILELTNGHGVYYTPEILGVNIQSYLSGKWMSMLKAAGIMKTRAEETEIYVALGEKVNERLAPLYEVGTVFRTYAGKARAHFNQSGTLSPELREEFLQLMIDHEPKVLSSLKMLYDYADRHVGGEEMSDMGGRFYGSITVVALGRDIYEISKIMKSLGIVEQQTTVAKQGVAGLLGLEP